MVYRYALTRIPIHHTAYSHPSGTQRLLALRGSPRLPPPKPPAVAGTQGLRMTGYLYESRVIDPEAPEAKSLLEQLHSIRARLLCRCVEPGPPMYLAKAGSRVIVKRMPDTGGEHSPSCESYEPPPELSGRGEVLGRAIQENADDGTAKLRLGFSLAKNGTRAKAEAEDPAADGQGDASKEADGVKTQGSKLTLQAFVHYLWEEARLNLWTPAMDSKRSWRVVRRHLLEALSGKSTSKASLLESVYIPEPFVLDDKAAITARRDQQLANYQQAKGGKGRLGMLVAEVKDIGDSRYGGKVTIKQVPDLPFLLPKDLYKSLLKKFDVALGLWSATTDSHLLIVATFGVSSAGLAEIQEAALINFDKQWLPFDTRHEYALLADLQAAGRRFVKGMRYNLAADKPLATAVLTDTQPIPVALYVLPPDVSEPYQDELDEIQRDSKLASWVWNIHEARPALPALEGYAMSRPADAE